MESKSKKRKINSTYEESTAKKGKLYKSATRDRLYSILTEEKRILFYKTVCDINDLLKTQLLNDSYKEIFYNIASNIDYSIFEDTEEIMLICILYYFKSILLFLKEEGYNYYNYKDQFVNNIEQLPTWWLTNKLHGEMNELNDDNEFKNYLEQVVYLISKVESEYEIKLNEFYNSLNYTNYDELDELNNKIFELTSLLYSKKYRLGVLYEHIREYNMISKSIKKQKTRFMETEEEITGAMDVEEDEKEISMEELIQKLKIIKEKIINTQYLVKHSDLYNLVNYGRLELNEDNFKTIKRNLTKEIEEIDNLLIVLREKQLLHIETIPLLLNEQHVQLELEKKMKQEKREKKWKKRREPSRQPVMAYGGGIFVNDVKEETENKKRKEVDLNIFTLLRSADSIHDFYKSRGSLDDKNRIFVSNIKFNGQSARDVYNGETDIFEKNDWFKYFSENVGNFDEPLVIRDLNQYIKYKLGEDSILDRFRIDFDYMGENLISFGKNEFEYFNNKFTKSNKDSAKYLIIRFNDNIDISKKESIYDAVKNFVGEKNEISIDMSNSTKKFFRILEDVAEERKKKGGVDNHIFVRRNMNSIHAEMWDSAGPGFKSTTQYKTAIKEVSRGIMTINEPLISKDVNICDNFLITLKDKEAEFSKDFTKVDKIYEEYKSRSVAYLSSIIPSSGSDKEKERKANEDNVCIPFYVKNSGDWGQVMNAKVNKVFLVTDDSLCSYYSILTKTPTITTLTYEGDQYTILYKEGLESTFEEYLDRIKNSINNDFFKQNYTKIEITISFIYEPQNLYTSIGSITIKSEKNSNGDINLKYEYNQPLAFPPKPQVFEPQKVYTYSGISISIDTLKTAPATGYKEDIFALFSDIYGEQKKEKIKEIVDKLLKDLGIIDTLVSKLLKKCKDKDKKITIGKKEELNDLLKQYLLKNYENEINNKNDINPENLHKYLEKALKEIIDENPIDILYLYYGLNENKINIDNSDLLEYKKTLDEMSDYKYIKEESVYDFILSKNSSDELTDELQIESKYERINFISGKKPSFATGKSMYFTKTDFDNKLNRLFLLDITQELKLAYESLNEEKIKNEIKTLEETIKKLDKSKKDEALTHNKGTLKVIKSFDISAPDDKFIILEEAFHEMLELINVNVKVLIKNKKIDLINNFKKSHFTENEFGFSYKFIPPRAYNNFDNVINGLKLSTGIWDDLYYNPAYLSLFFKCYFNNVSVSNGKPEKFPMKINDDISWDWTLKSGVSKKVKNDDLNKFYLNILHKECELNFKKILQDIELKKYYPEKSLEILDNAGLYRLYTNVWEIFPKENTELEKLCSSNAVIINEELKKSFIELVYKQWNVRDTGKGKKGKKAVNTLPSIDITEDKTISLKNLIDDLKTKDTNTYFSKLKQNFDDVYNTIELPDKSIFEEPKINPITLDSWDNLKKIIEILDIHCKTINNNSRYITRYYYIYDYVVSFTNQLSRLVEFFLERCIKYVESNTFLGDDIKDVLINKFYEKYTALLESFRKEVDKTSGNTSIILNILHRNLSDLVVFTGVKKIDTQKITKLLEGKNPLLIFACDYFDCVTKLSKDDFMVQTGMLVNNSKNTNAKGKKPMNVSGNVGMEYEITSCDQHTLPIFSLKRNSCFFDSVLFALFSMPTETIKNLKKKEMRNVYVHTGEISYYINPLKKDERMRFINILIDGNYADIDLNEERDKLRESILINNKDGTVVSQWNTGNQEDSREFLNSFLQLYSNNNLLEWIEAGKRQQGLLCYIDNIEIDNKELIEQKSLIGDNDLFIVNLNRFSGMDDSKNNTEVLMEKTYTLKSGDVIVLTHVIVHMGDTTKDGHYLVYFICDGTWYLYDNQKNKIVKPSAEEVNSEISKNGYLFFYKKTNSMKNSNMGIGQIAGYHNRFTREFINDISKYHLNLSSNTLIKYSKLLEQKHNLIKIIYKLGNKCCKEINTDTNNKKYKLIGKELLKYTELLNNKEDISKYYKDLKNNLIKTKLFIKSIL